MEYISAVIALPCNRAQDKGRNFRIAAKAHGSISLIAGLHHEGAEGPGVTGFNFAHNEVWRIGERQDGERFHDRYILTTIPNYFKGHHGARHGKVVKVPANQAYYEDISLVWGTK